MRLMIRANGEILLSNNHYTICHTKTGGRFLFFIILLKGLACFQIYDPNLTYFFVIKFDLYSMRFISLFKDVIAE